jgi:hypothetical protein
VERVGLLPAPAELLSNKLSTPATSIVVIVIKDY